MDMPSISIFIVILVMSVFAHFLPQFTRPEIFLWSDGRPLVSEHR